MFKFIIEIVALIFLVVNVKLSIDSYFLYRYIFKKYNITSQKQAMVLIENKAIPNNDRKVIKNYMHTL